MNNYFIMHGSLGNPFENWFPWLQDTLSLQKKSVFVPQFPTPEGQCYNSWSQILKTYLDLGFINEQTIFIAHSIAPIFVCKFLIQNHIKVKGLISVCGFNELLENELDKINQTFLMENKELEKIIDYTDFIYCFYSDNDPYIKIEYLEKFIKIVRGEKFLIPNAGHFNIKSGYTKFTEILEVINQSENSLSFMEDDDLPVGINAIVRNEKGEILLSKRKNRYGAGTYSLIGGKLKKGETFESCIIRELKEEIDIDVKENDLEIINFANTINSKNHFIQIGVLINHYTGTPKNMEENKCEEINFFNLNNLPSNLFDSTKPNIMLFKNNSFYNKNENIFK